MNWGAFAWAAFGLVAVAGLPVVVFMAVMGYSFWQEWRKMGASCDRIEREVDERLRNGPVLQPRRRRIP